MKVKEQKASELVAEQPVFHKVAENLYRLESSGGYYALLKRGGKQFRRSLKTKDRKLADRRLNDLRAKIGCLQISPEARLSFTQAAQLWLETNKHALSSSTVKRKEMYVKGLLPFFENMPVRNVMPQDCDRWVKERGAALASETYFHELDVLKAVFDFALGRGLILSNPAQHIKRRRVISKTIIVPTLDQFQELVRTIRQSDGRKDSQEKAKDGADLVEFLAYSGARIGEVTGGTDANEKRPLLWADVQTERGTIFLPGTKTEAAPRTIPMSEKLRELLVRLRHDPPDGAFLKANSQSTQIPACNLHVMIDERERNDVAVVARLELCHFQEVIATDGPVEHHHGIRSVRPHIPFLGGRQIQPFQRGHDGFFLTNQSLSFQSIPHPLIDLVNF